MLEGAVEKGKQGKMKERKKSVVESKSVKTTVE
jgi:hypothetical protein